MSDFVSTVNDFQALTKDFMSLLRALCIITTVKINMNNLKIISFFIARVQLKLYNALKLTILPFLHIFPHIGHMNFLNSQNLCKELFILSIIIIMSRNHLYLWALKFIDLLKEKKYIFHFVTFTGTFWNFCDIYWKKWHFLIFFLCCDVYWRVCDVYWRVCDV